MPRTVPTAPTPVNAAWPWRALVRDQLAIWLMLGGGALVGYLSGVETWLAQAAYQPDLSQTWGAVAWWLRQWGAAVPGYLAVACLLALFWPKLWQRRPLVYQACAVVALSALLGAGLVNQVLIQELADRHRPRETLLVGVTSQQLPAELTGNSMPSGHAGIAFCLAAPFFVWRQRRPHWAQAALATGLASGLVVGGGRIVLGAHYLSDVLIAGAIALSTASVLALLLARYRRIPLWLLLGGFAVAGAGVVLGNHFKLTLTTPLPTPLPRLDLPCVVTAIATPAGGQAGVLQVHLTGFGAPVSGLRLAVTPERVELQRGFGIFHSLSCQATLTLDKAE